MSIDLSKLTPAPWSWSTSYSFRRLTGGDGKDGGVLSAITQRSDGHPDIVGKQDDMEFIVLARNAFDVMMRRGWTAYRNTDKSWIVISLDHYDNKPVVVSGARYSDPCTALIEDDAWYKEHVEKVTA